MSQGLHAGQPPSTYELRSRLWQTFNAELLGTAAVDLNEAAAAEIRNGRPTAVARLNDMLAVAVQVVSFTSMSSAILSGR